ncbi:MAG: glycosyltransferase family 2 protein [Lachnospiraceae bacterium]|jgi:GT2 family glycosyltransferase|nr:glycosyltransferase family 2 protein [Lachnospiraceae bacterium]MEE3461041.1 glycosyltransferase family 2 protein [Lachnospiraceae bacterium]
MELKFFLFEHEFTRTCVQIWFGLKKCGIKNFNSVISEEIYHHRVRIPFYVNKQELKRQRHHEFRSPVHFIIGIRKTGNDPDEDRKVKRTIDSVNAGSYGNVIHFILENIETISDKFQSSDLNSIRNQADFWYLELRAGDLLHPYLLYRAALYIDNHKVSLLYTDDRVFSGNVKNVIRKEYKPDFSKYALMSSDYIGSRFFVNYSRYKILGGFDSGRCGSGMYYDFLMRAVEKKQNIGHMSGALIYIPEETYYYGSREEEEDAELKVLNDYIARIGIRAHAESIDDKDLVNDMDTPGCYDRSLRHISFEITSRPKVSIIIPNKDQVPTLKRCIDSIIAKTSYDNYEILVVENNSEEQETFEYYRELAGLYASEKSDDDGPSADHAGKVSSDTTHEKIRVITYKGIFNYSAINNFAVKESHGSYLLFLNNDTEVINGEWLTEMLSLCIQEDTGAVGAKLLYPDETIQHAGIIVGIGGMAGHSHKYLPADAHGYMNRLMMTQEVSAVTGACLLVSRTDFEYAGGFDEDFKVALNDVDLCLKILKNGKKNLFTPFARLYHYESKSRGLDTSPERRKRLEEETVSFVHKWKDFMDNGDPYYNINLSLRYEDFRER